MWRVKNKITGEYFAMKIMPEGFRSKSTSERQLLQEYNLKSVLKSSCKNHLTCYHDVFRIKNKLFLIMTIAEGKPLSFYMDKNILTFSQKEKITNDLILAIGNLHFYNISHRDIKPENIIYDIEKNYTTLVDYGLSCIPNVTSRYKPDCDHKAGTPNFWHPDIRRLDNNKIDWIKSDTFSMAYCLYLLWIAPAKEYLFTGDIVGYIEDQFFDFNDDIKYADLLKNKPTEEIVIFINKLFLSTISINK